MRIDFLRMCFLDIVLGKRGDGYIDTAVKIIISVVVGGLLLSGVYSLFNDVVIPQMTSKISSMF